LRAFAMGDAREIVFKLMVGDEVHHTIVLEGSGAADYRSVVGFFAGQLLKELRLVGGYDVLYGKVKTFIRDHLFEPSPVKLEDPVVLRNLSEPEAGKIIFDSFKKAINELTIRETGTTRIEDRIRLRDTRPFRTDCRPYLAATKSVFNKVVGDAQAGGFELSFAAFLEGAPDVAAFAKNYLAVGFKLDYVKADGDLSNYIPDFLARTADGTVWVVETKGRQEIDLPNKMSRLRQWCADASAASIAEGGPAYRFVFVDQDGFARHKPADFAGLAAAFRDYRED
jgi:type III restriction enzyme